MTSFPSFVEHLVAILANSWLAVLLQGDDRSPTCWRAQVPGDEGLWRTAVSAPLACPKNLIVGVLKSPLHNQRAGRRFPGLRVPWIGFSIASSIFLDSKSLIMKEFVVIDLKSRA